MPKRVARPKTRRRPKTREIAPPLSDRPAEALVQFSRPNNPGLQGFTDQRGKPYVSISHQALRVPISLASFDSGGARAQLRAHNMIFGTPEWDNFLLDVNAIRGFPPRLVADRPGSTGPAFAMPSGTIIAPEGSEPPVVLFEPTPAHCQPAGRLSEWRRGIGDALANATKSTFAVMAVFASPLLPLVDAPNFGFNFVGVEASSLDRLLQLSTSVISRPNGPPGDRYVISGTTPPKELLSLITRFSALPLIIADVDTYAANMTDRPRAARFDELFAGLASGRTAAKPRAERSEPAAFVYIMTSREAASSISARLRPTAHDRATEHMFTVPIRRQKPDLLQARMVEDLTTANYAVAMVSFLKNFVTDRSTDEAALKAEIAGSTAKFRSRVGAATADPATARAIDAFALVYAAGRLAQRYGALPKSLSCMKAAVACYDANRLIVTGQAPFLDRLKALAKNPKTLRVDPRNLPSISDEELERLPAILRASASGKDELLLRPAALSRAFPNKKLLFRDQSLVGIIKHDGGRITVKRAIRSDKTSDRVICIRLP